MVQTGERSVWWNRRSTYLGNRTYCNQGKRKYWTAFGSEWILIRGSIFARQSGY